jgi:hypothetical protein
MVPSMTRCCRLNEEIPIADRTVSQLVGPLIRETRPSDSLTSSSRLNNSTLSYPHSTGQSDRITSIYLLSSVSEELVEEESSLFDFFFDFFDFFSFFFFAFFDFFF